MDIFSKWMPNTFTQIEIHCVFAVKFRESLIAASWKEEMHRFMTGTIQHFEHSVLQVNSVSDHVHVLIEYDPRQSLSELMQIVKAESSKFINRKYFCKERFRWQEGYGAFSCDRSRVPELIGYIQNQVIHHKKVLFLDEYRELLRKAELFFEENYIFHPPL